MQLSLIMVFLYSVCYIYVPCNLCFFLPVGSLSAVETGSVQNSTSEFKKNQSFCSNRCKPIKHRDAKEVPNVLCGY